MDKGLELLSSETSVAHEGEPRLNLLVEREPAHEIFFSNLVHTFQPAPAVKSLAPGELWHDVFLPTSLPWKSLGIAALAFCCDLRGLGAVAGMGQPAAAACASAS